MRWSPYVWMMKKASTGDTVGTNRRERGLTRNWYWMLPLGPVAVKKKDEFSEKFWRGGGTSFQSKNWCCSFWTCKQSFCACNLKKNCNMIFRKWGGDQRPFGIFPKIHPFWYRHSILRHELDKRMRSVYRFVEDGVSKSCLMPFVKDFCVGPQ